ncbi:MAG TPA: PTS sugar transporter subunit IIA [Sedimentisphaerales bacterium]|nr:PTS sugar transporter subunit IIA [Sedimentisphaerales bacterium]
MPCCRREAEDLLRTPSWSRRDDESAQEPDEPEKCLARADDDGYTSLLSETASAIFSLVVFEMILTQILQPTCVKVPLDGKDKYAVITELVTLLDENKLIQNRQMVLDTVFTREQTRSTGIGSGIAIPHGKCGAVKELVMALGVADSSIDFDSVDGKPVSIVILLVSPQDQTGPHIQALARISRLMLDEDFKAALEKASSSEAAYKLMSERETR